MTVCIAAVCENRVERTAKIVLCTDGKAGGPMGSKELAQKDFYIAHRWRCLTAGSDNDINSFLPAVKARFNACTTIDETTIQQTIRLAIGDLKLQRCNEFTRGRYGLPYDEFLRDGKSKFPDDQFRADVFAIGSIVPDIECIIAGFDDNNFPMLLLANGKGAADIKEEFAVAGEGGYLAEASMLQRQHNDIETLQRTLYCVYEAKKNAQRVGSVNDVTNMSVLSGEGLDAVRDAGLGYLQSIYKRCRPRPIPKSIVIEPDFLRRVPGSEPIKGPKAGSARSKHTEG